MDVLIFLTSDRGSNIQSAINKSEGTILGVPCLSHVYHHAAIAAMDEFKESADIGKNLKVASLFHKSVPLAPSSTKYL